VKNGSPTPSEAAPRGVRSPTSGYRASQTTLRMVIASEAKQSHRVLVASEIATAFGLAMTRALLNQFCETQ
jgi:hypothetical protein